MANNKTLEQRCPHCEARYTITRSGTGTTAKCWSCGKEIEVTGRIAVMTRQLRRALERENKKRSSK